MNTLFPGFKEKWTRWRCRLAAGSAPPPPELVFQRFRAVLGSNNRALEIIADLGEKLGGDFIFDSHYIETSLEHLLETTAGSVEAINELTACRFPELAEVHQRLTAELAETVRNREDLGGPLWLPLDQVEPTAWSLVGGKAAHLAELRRDPLLSVPDGFVLTSCSYRRLLAANGLDHDLARFEELLAQPAADEVRLEKLRAELEQRVRTAHPFPELLSAFDKGVARLRPTARNELYLAVRSSAQEEDQDFSFAGQFHSELQIPADTESLFTAYRRVVASLFAPGAVEYRRRVFPGEGKMSIAVVCQPMVTTRTSGVAFSVDAADPGSDAMVVVAAWGQGAAVVEGRTATDTFLLAKDEETTILERTIANKDQALEPASAGGLAMQPVEASRRTTPCLSDAELARLGSQVKHLETSYKKPQDVEWAVDVDGVLHILQARTLLLPVAARGRQTLPARLDGADLIADNAGRVAQHGIGAGPVRFVHNQADLADFPEGAVLVSRRDASNFVRVMGKAAAIVTEIGTPVSHMATLCREFQVPCLVGVDSICARLADGEQITVDADDRRIYRGRVPELLAFRAAAPMNFGVSREFRLLRRVLKKVSRLHLVDPLLQDFSVAGIRTVHDLLRFVHEQAVLELTRLGRDEKRLLAGSLARPMDLPVPAGVLVIDIGGALAEDASATGVPFTAVRSAPLRAILQGMLFPGVWHRTAMAVGLRDLMNSMLSAPADTLDGRYSGHNIAIASDEYVNLCFRLGYHFNIIDAHCSATERDNHIYFRFLGGASDMAKRSRRAVLIARILEAFDFHVQTKGDMVIARAGNMVQPEMERTLDILGRLVGFTRQLDVRLEHDGIVDRYVEAFLYGDYGIVGE